MCLWIKDLKRSNDKIAKLRKIGKPVVAWKILRNVDQSYFFPGFLYANGLNKSGRKATYLTPKEKTYDVIYNGFHCYLTRTDARKRKMYRFTKNINLRKVIINPKDLVAYGNMSGFEPPNAPDNCLVCTKLTMDLKRSH